MDDTHEQVLLALKYVDDVTFDEDYESSIYGEVTGFSLKVVARTRADGRTAVSASVFHRIQRLRASGKAFHYWQPVQFVSIARTRADLLVKREFTRSNMKRLSSHVFAGDTTLETWLGRFGYDLDGKLRQMHTPRALEGPASAAVDAALRETIFTRIQEAAAAARAHLGEPPVWAERFPLLAEQASGYLPGHGYLPYLDARDQAQVARNVFGVRAYRKPLVAEIRRLDMHTISWFQLFRGLVPIDWIIEAMRATPERAFHDHQRTLTGLQRRQIRRILRRTPEPVLRRILAEPISQSSQVLADAAAAVGNVAASTRDLDLLPGLIAARGQRRVRSSRDLEQLVHAIPERHVSLIPRREVNERVMQNEIIEHQSMSQYNQDRRDLPDGIDAPEATWQLWKDPAFRQQALGLIQERRRELMDARRRRYAEQEEARRAERIARQAERHAWARRTEETLEGLEVAPGLVIETARSPETLSMWGAVMNNCIGDYDHELGLDVLAAVVDAPSRTVRLNLQITLRDGVVQFLGKNNRDAVRELPRAIAQQIVDRIHSAGVPFARHALGVDGLSVPQA